MQKSRKDLQALRPADKWKFVKLDSVQAGRLPRRTKFGFREGLMTPPRRTVRWLRRHCRSGESQRREDDGRIWKPCSAEEIRGVTRESHRRGNNGNHIALDVGFIRRHGPTRGPLLKTAHCRAALHASFDQRTWSAFGRDLASRTGHVPTTVKFRFLISHFSFSSVHHSSFLVSVRPADEISFGFAERTSFLRHSHLHFNRLSRLHVEPLQPDRGGAVLAARTAG